MEMSSCILTYFYNDNQRRISATRLLQATIYNMENAISGNGPKIVLYSSHDTTIYALLVALNMTNLNCLTEQFFAGKGST
jgi:hypothetical protein